MADLVYIVAELSTQPWEILGSRPTKRRVVGVFSSEPTARIHLEQTFGGDDAAFCVIGWDDGPVEPPSPDGPDPLRDAAKIALAVVIIVAIGVALVDAFGGGC